MDLLSASEAVLNRVNIQTFEDVKKCSEQIISFSDEMKADRKELEEFLNENFYQSPRVTKIVTKAEECLKGLFQIYSHAPRKMPKHFFEKTKETVDARERIICDYIAGMTDRFALDEYERLKHTPTP